MDLELAGKVVLVTGASAGLGAATAARLITEGANVAICARDESRLEATAKELSRGPGEILAVPADVSDPAAITGFVESAHARWGRVDALVNNAGGGAARPFDEITDAEWERDLGIKVVGAARATRIVLPLLQEVGGGAVVNVLAIAAKAPGARSAPSSVSRAAGLALTKALSKELGPLGVRVNAVLVGVVRAGGHERRATASGLGVEAFYEELARERQVPLGRVGRAEEFADLVSFLVSPRSSYTTGSAVNIDGGASAVA